MKRNFRAGQWVWYWGKKGICNGAITRIENGICKFEFEGCPTIEVEEKKCYISIEELKNDNKKRS